MASDREWREAWLGAERYAFGDAAPDRDPATTLQALLARAPTGLEVDRYGGGELAERLERRVSELLGKEAAVWMPSGTMAQQIALRIHADRTGRTVVAFHPQCHLEAHEESAYRVLHGLRATLLGGRERLIETTDVEELREPIAALVLELPQRDLGGQLPPWDDLVATCDTARGRGAALHLDGARLWQCGPFYERPPAEIAALFDTVYVSFYKNLGAPAGCALAGPEDVIREARVWQIRHGGRLFSAYPYLLAAEVGLDEHLPRIPELVARARLAGEALAAIDDVTVVPGPPHTAMLHVIVRRPLEALNHAVYELTRESRIWFSGEFRATGDPGSQRCELSATAANLAVPVDEVIELWSELLRRAANVQAEDVRPGSSP
jgi:threonine aldolase